MLTSWKAAASPLPGVPVPGLQRPRGGGWGTLCREAHGVEQVLRRHPVRPHHALQPDSLSHVCTWGARSQMHGVWLGPPRLVSLSLGAHSPRLGPSGSWGQAVEALKHTCWGKSPEAKNGRPQSSHHALRKPQKNKNSECKGLGQGR